jgi:hypothetical protein
MDTAGDSFQRLFSWIAGTSPAMTIFVSLAQTKTAPAPHLG